MDKKLIIAGLTGLALTGILTVPAYAADNCAVDEETVSFSGKAEMCVITENVSEINITSTIEDLVDILYGYKVDNNYGYSTFATGATFNATVTNDFSTDGITAVGAQVPAGANVVLNQGTKDLVFLSTSYTMPSYVTINYATDAIIHMPQATTPNEAAALFEQVGVAGATVAINDAVDGLETITQASDGTMVLHLMDGTSIADALAIANTITVVSSFATASMMDYWTDHDATDGLTIHLIDENITAEEALAMLAGVDTDATVVVDGNDSFTITLKTGETPVVNEKTNIVEDDEIGAPTTGFFTIEDSGAAQNIALTALISAVMVFGVVALVSAKKRATEKE